MAVTPPVAYGILFAVGLLVLVGFVIMFTRLGRAADRSKEPRTLAPVAWPISTHEPPQDEPPAKAGAPRRPNRGPSARQ